MTLLVERAYPGWGSGTLNKEVEQMKGPYRVGVIVLVGLAILTIIEFGLALVGGLAVPLLLVAVFKAALILEYYMHFSHLWGKEGGAR